MHLYKLTRTSFPQVIIEMNALDFHELPCKDTYTKKKNKEEQQKKTFYKRNLLHFM